MIPVEATAAQVEFWEARDGCRQFPVVVGGPAEGEDVIPCPALVAKGTFTEAGTGTVQEVDLVHVAYELDEIEVAALAQGGTLWLTTWGGLPIHRVEVIGPSAGKGGLP